ncbi:MAG: class I SAM-dependent methyltransferase [Sulfitobacter sp.]|nr:class I SAM-dependent methyltransferase [Sulfitobacter sp.]
MPENVEFETQTGMWVLSSRASIPYSEGARTERRLLEILHRAPDLSAFQPLLVPPNADWPVTYHLHADRGNVVAGFEFSEGTSILEVGAGCGAITRVLGEATDGPVVALEGAHKRAEICAARVRDLLNTEVVAAPLGDVDFGPVFDVVVVIGVLEYAEQFIGDVADPHDEFIKRCASQLKPGGTLILAIENQLGLKYLAGAPEDHTGRRFDGPEGYPRQIGGPRTFGRRQLRQLVAERFEHVDMYLAYPDYKLAKFVASESLASSHDLSSVITHVLRDPQDGRVANESLLTRTFAANRLTADTANSFVVVAYLGDGERAVRFPSSAVLFGHRFSDRPTRITSFVEGPDGGVEVFKAIDESRASWPESSVNWSPSSERWVEGTSVQDLVLRVARAGSSVEACVLAAAPWWEAILSLSNDDGNIPGTHLDATWANCALDDSGVIRFFDLEWSMETPVSPMLPLFRSISTVVDIVRRERISSPFRTMPERDLRERFAREWSHSVGPADHQAYADVITELNFVLAGTDRETTFRSANLKLKAGRAWPMYANTAPARRAMARNVDRARRKLSIELTRLRSR